MNRRWNAKRTEYRSFLLRLWRSGERGEWRAMLEQVGSAERHSFASLQDLLAFLQAQSDLPPFADNRQAP
jgi:hypothetical protein